jgi:hypothetical protein
VSLLGTPFDVVPWMLGATVLALVAVLRRPAASPAAFASAVALVYGVFFAFSKQSFCNYWWFVLGVLCCGLAAARPAMAPSLAADAPDPAVG